MIEICLVKYQNITKIEIIRSYILVAARVYVISDSPDGSEVPCVVASVISV